MDLVQICIFIFISILIGIVARGLWRSWAILVVSVMAIFWLQPASSIRHLDFWFPTLSLGLVILSWVVSVVKIGGTTRDPMITREAIVTRDDRFTFAVILLLYAAIGLTRYTGEFRLTPTAPPGFEAILLIVMIIGGTAFLLSRYSGSSPVLIYMAGFALVILFVALKSQPLGDLISEKVRTLTGQSTEFASSLDLGWLGFSYIAFRLLHTLREAASGKMPRVSLREYVSYALFFPALTAGPIDRVERFQKDLENREPLNAEVSFEAGQRLVTGVFKKFVLADTLAMFSLNGINALQVNSGLWLWLMLYAYAFRLYLDFSGYTDIAIGIGKLVGVQLPENFNRPYLKSNLTAFWNSWHITLAQWFRAYFFNPLTRAFRRMKVGLPAPAIILIAQAGTMALIGLWHGIAWNYLFWGLWHGIGLFLHNRWVNLQRTRPGIFSGGLLSGRAGHILSMFLTFQFIVVGWIWFVIPDVGQAWATLLRLFGG